MRMKRDLMTSVIGHLVLLAIILLFNPTAGMFHGKPEIMTVSLSSLTPPGGGDQSKPAEMKPLTLPKPAEDEKIDDPYKLQSSKKLEKIEKPKEKAPEPKAETKVETKKESAKSDGKGGIDVSTKVGAGSGDAEGENIGGGSNVPYNLGLVLSVIERSWRNPVTSSKTITCTLYFQINRDGTILTTPIVEKSSGLAVFDQSCIQAIMRAGQFPAFPTDFGYDYIGLHLDFEYAP